MTNKEKFLALVSKEETQTIDRAKARLAKRSYSKLSNLIAFEILERLDELGWSQKKLAENMDVSPQQVNKWVKGNENFTLSTLGRLGEVLGIELVQVPSRTAVKFTQEMKLPIETSDYKIPEPIRNFTPVIKMRAVV